VNLEQWRGHHHSVGSPHNNHHSIPAPEDVNKQTPATTIMRPQDTPLSSFFGGLLNEGCSQLEATLVVDNAHVHCFVPKIAPHSPKTVTKVSRWESSPPPQRQERKTATKPKQSPRRPRRSKSDDGEKAKLNKERFSSNNERASSLQSPRRQLTPDINFDIE